MDTLGNPIRSILTGGQVADITRGVALVKAIPTGAVIADKGYDSDALVQTIEATGAQAMIPPRSNRNSPRRIDRHRHKASEIRKPVIVGLFGVRARVRLAQGS